MYDERFVTPMRQELTQLGVEEMRTPQEVDARLKNSQGTTLVVVNSVCGCAARNARPAVEKAIQHDTRPECRRRAAGEELFHRLRSELSSDRAVQGCKARLYAGASSDRGAHCRRYRAGSDGRIRQGLRGKYGRGGYL